MPRRSRQAGYGDDSAWRGRLLRAQMTRSACTAGTSAPALAAAASRRRASAPGTRGIKLYATRGRRNPRPVIRSHHPRWPIPSTRGAARTCRTADVRRTLPKACLRERQRASPSAALRKALPPARWSSGSLPAAAPRPRSPPLPGGPCGHGLVCEGAAEGRVKRDELTAWKNKENDFGSQPVEINHCRR